MPTTNSSLTLTAARSSGRPAVLTLYYAPRTRAVRIRWLLEELELPHVLERVPFAPPTGGWFS